MMQFDWTTFTLEILNFLVLVWILKRLFYKPILDRLDARQQKITHEKAQAEKLRNEADDLRKHYETRLRDWENEMEDSRRKLQDELAQLRHNELEKLKIQLTDEETKLRSRNQAMIASREAALEWEATGSAYEKAAAMLQRLASAHLTESILDVFLEDLQTLSENEKSALKKAAKQLAPESVIEVISAHPFSVSLHEKLNQSLSTLTGEQLRFKCRVDPHLIAGLRIMMGEYQLLINLADELEFFRRQTLNG